MEKSSFDAQKSAMTSTLNSSIRTPNVTVWLNVLRPPQRLAILPKLWVFKSHACRTYRILLTDINAPPPALRPRLLAGASFLCLIRSWGRQTAYCRVNKFRTGGQVCTRAVSLETPSQKGTKFCSADLSRKTPAKSRYCARV